MGFRCDLCGQPVEDIDQGTAAFIADLTITGMKAQGYGFADGARDALVVALAFKPRTTATIQAARDVAREYVRVC